MSIAWSADDNQFASLDASFTLRVWCMKPAPGARAARAGPSPASGVPCTPAGGATCAALYSVPSIARLRPPRTNGVRSTELRGQSRRWARARTACSPQSCGGKSRRWARARVSRAGQAVSEDANRQPVVPLLVMAVNPRAAATSGACQRRQRRATQRGAP